MLDCDNTLWGGVIGEDGLGGIELGSAFPGSGYQGLQKVLKTLKDRGVLLAIASKNNPQEVADVFAQHDEMVLKAETSPSGGSTGTRSRRACARSRPSSTSASTRWS